jgi:hypothetical protein
MRAGQEIFITLNQNVTEAEVSSDLSYESMSLGVGLPARGRSLGPLLGYGFADNYAQKRWTWGGNGARTKEIFSAWFAD